MSRKKISANIKIDDDVFEILDATASRLRRYIREGKLPSRGRGKSWGAGTVAAYLVERIVREQPKLLEDWVNINVISSLVDEENSKTQTMDNLFEQYKDVLHPDEQGNKAQARPKARGGRKTKEHASL